MIPHPNAVDPKGVGLAPGRSHLRNGCGLRVDLNTDFHFVYFLRLKWARATLY
jgi:hypothetical protein